MDIDSETKETKMGELRIMGAKGDTKHIWNPRDPDETAAAKAIWDDLVGKKKFVGFKVKKGGDPGERMTEFDPEAGKLIIAPPMAADAMPDLYFEPTGYFGPPAGTYYPAWQVWVNQTTTSGYMANLPPQTMGTMTTNSTVWDNWQTQLTSPIVFNPPIANYTWESWQTGGTLDHRPLPIPVVSAEQKQAMEQRRKRFTMVNQNRARARRIRQRIAKQTAELLLVECLSESQREQWQKSKSFTVVTADGLREYRINRGMAGNITLVKCQVPPTSKYGNPLHIGARFCMHVYHPEGWVPDEDNVLAQKLLLESPAGEAEFLAHANVS